jgi:hypothetical protein
MTGKFSIKTFGVDYSIQIFYIIKIIFDSLHDVGQFLNTSP